MFYECKICDKDFDKIKSLHYHLRSHSITIKNYYLTYYPKFDLLTGEAIKFKNHESYLSSDFANIYNFKNWISEQPKEISGPYVLKKLEARSTEKKLKFLPANLYFVLSELGDFNIYNNLFGDADSLSQQLKLKNLFSKDLPNDFWDYDPDLPIFIDTREQLPIKYNKSISQKLDFGDYTCGGEHYSKTFIDRKSENDFKGTFGRGIDRFRREMDRCKEFGSYMFVLVESDIDSIKMYNGGKSKCNLDFVWHNVRSLLSEYDNLQVVFAHTRGGVKKLIPKILYHGNKLWDVDMDFYLNKKINDKKG